MPVSLRAELQEDDEAGSPWPRRIASAVMVLFAVGIGLSFFGFCLRAMAPG
jgi:hypothetical protein